MTTPPADQRERSLRRWKRIVRYLQAAFAAAVVFAVWSVAFVGDGGPPPVLPDTQEQFSLDLDVIGTIDRDIVYVVEQRARPAYRIFSFDPSTGDVQTVFTVPTDAIIYGIALSGDRQTLALAYTPDFEIDGSGISTIDVSRDLPVDPTDMTMVIEATTDRYLTDIVWSDDDTVMATEVDRRGEEEELSVVAMNTVDGTIETVSENAVEPAPAQDYTYFLEVDKDNARRTIGRVGGDGERRSIEYADLDLDLDQLVISNSDALSVAVVENNDGGLAIGSIAEAHGNHDVPSAWWTITVDPTTANSSWKASTLDETIVYDTSSIGNGFVYATREGLSFGDPGAGADGKVDVIASRAVRFVAS